jgi:hypothetical protein
MRGCDRPLARPRGAVRCPEFEGRDRLVDRTSSDSRSVVVTGTPARESAKAWRCCGCGSLLGVERGRELHLKYKDVEAWIVGTCRRVCRRCGEMNTIAVGTSQEKS